MTTAGLAGVPTSGSNLRTQTGMDFEPEYIAVDKRGDQAYVTLQEANAIGVLDLRKGRFTRVIGLGAKDFSLPGNQINPFNNGVTEFNTGFTSGIPAAGGWHNYAVEFTSTTVEFFVDEVSRGSLDLTTFNGGSFLGYSNAWVGAGNTGATTSAGFPISWSDNFQVGAPVPEPTSFALAGLAVVGLLSRRRK